MEVSGKPRFCEFKWEGILDERGDPEEGRKAERGERPRLEEWQ